MKLDNKHIAAQYSNLLKLASVDVVPEIFNILGINYTIIDADGNYIIQNTSTINQISNGAVKAYDIDKTTWEDCLQVMRGGQKSIKEEIFKGRFYLSIKQPLFEKSICVGILIISLDITEKKQAEIAKAEFLKNMSHDIRTPFAGILGIARLLYCDESDSNKQVYLGDLVESSERLLALLNEILDISHIGSQPLQFSDINLTNIINEVVELMLAAIRLKGLTLNIDSANLVLNTDKYRLSRILINLVSNAVKFTNEGSITIKVDIQPKLKITVEDTGIGISQENLQVIFDKFTKIKSSGESQEFTGAGIGLYQAKQFAKEIHGDIFVESELGKGSKFSFVQL